MESSNPFFLLFALLVFLISSPLFLANADVKLIEAICKKSNERAFCFKVLKADPQASAAKTNCELANAILQLTIKKAQETQNFLKELAKTDNSSYLQNCSVQDYDYVLESYYSALAELVEDVTTANYDAAVADDGANMCQSRLPPNGSHNAEISSRNKETVMYGNIAYAVTLPLSDNCPT